MGLEPDAGWSACEDARRTTHVFGARYRQRKCDGVGGANRNPQPGCDTNLHPCRPCDSASRRAIRAYQLDSQPNRARVRECAVQCGGHVIVSSQIYLRCATALPKPVVFVRAPPKHRLRFPEQVTVHPVARMAPADVALLEVRVRVAEAPPCRRLAGEGVGLLGHEMRAVALIQRRASRPPHLWLCRRSARPRAGSPKVHRD